MRIYVLYLDVYFLENVLLNLVLLIFTFILTGRRIRFIRLLSASLIGGMMAILPIILRLRYGIACDYNCIGNEEYVRTMDSNAAFLCNVFCLE